MSESPPGFTSGSSSFPYKFALTLIDAWCWPVPVEPFSAGLVSAGSESVGLAIAGSVSAGPVSVGPVQVRFARSASGVGPVLTRSVSALAVSVEYS